MARVELESSDCGEETESVNKFYLIKLMQKF